MPAGDAWRSASILRRKTRSTSPSLEPLLAVILWGGVYPGVKLGLRDIPVLSFTALRILVAMVMLFVASGSVQALSLPRSLWPLVLKAGLARRCFNSY